MKIDLHELIKLQTDLDNLVFTNNKASYYRTKHFRKLAVLVELGELANEIKAFKFWSKNKNTDQHRILDELVDVMHFLLSALVATKSDICELTILGSTKKVNANEYDKIITLKFIELFQHVSNSDDDDAEPIVKSLVLLIKLGFAAGFSWPMIKKAYKEKNLVNISRQQNNY